MTPEEQAAERARRNAEAEARMAGVTSTTSPQTTSVGTRYDRPWWQFGFGEGDPSDINAYILSQAAAGRPTNITEADFYDYLRQAQAAGRGIGGQQQGLADALRARAEGRGPSVAQLQLQQTLDANQRAAAGALATAGRTINPGLAQELLLAQRAAMSQQAAGQGSILRAQEQIAAQNALANQLAQMRGAETAAFQQSGQLGLGQERLRSELTEAQKQRELDIALANQRAAQVAAGQAASDASSAQANATKGAAAVASAGVEGYKAYKNTPPPAAPSAPAVTPAPAPAAANGGMLRNRRFYSDGGYVDGGMVEGCADGGKISKAKIIAAHAAAKKNMKSFQKEYGKTEGKDIAYATMTKLAKENKLADGGIPTALPALILKGLTGMETDDAMLTVEGAKELFDLGNSLYKKYEEDKNKKRLGMAEGGQIEKLKTLDNPKNDTVPAMLSEGEIVVPRSIVASPDAPRASAEFVRALLQNKDKQVAKDLALRAATKMR